jgi:hypothetical protein
MAGKWASTATAASGGSAGRLQEHGSIIAGARGADGTNPLSTSDRDPKLRASRYFRSREERSSKLQFLFEFVAETILAGLGALIKKLFGRPLSESGISEMWIGTLVVVAAIVIVIMAAR